MRAYTKKQEISIDNLYDLAIWQKELSYLKLCYNYSKFDCIKNRETLYAYYRSHLGSSLKKDFIDSLITSFSEIEKIIKVNANSFELTEKFPVYMKKIEKSIKTFQKKRHDEMNYFDFVNCLPQSTKISEVKAYDGKEKGNFTATN